jgi:hypothetical protein
MRQMRASRFVNRFDTFFRQVSVLRRFGRTFLPVHSVAVGKVSSRRVAVVKNIDHGLIRKQQVPPRHAGTGRVRS